MSWRFPPETPTAPGLYAVLQTAIASDTPRLLRWTNSAAGWRLGARREPVVAFLGPIPECVFPHADYESKFVPPVRDVPIPRAPARRSYKDHNR